MPGGTARPGVFTRPSVRAVRAGRRQTKPGRFGLGLHIAFGKARAHNGTLDVTSTDEETKFTFRMPLTALNQGASAERAASS
jgi:signal transduction histidine kinase